VAAVRRFDSVLSALSSVLPRAIHNSGLLPSIGEALSQRFYAAAAEWQSAALGLMAQSWPVDQCQNHSPDQAEPPEMADARSDADAVRWRQPGYRGQGKMVEAPVHEVYQEDNAGTGATSFPSFDTGRPTHACG